MYGSLRGGGWLHGAGFGWSRDGLGHEKHVPAGQHQTEDPPRAVRDAQRGAVVDRCQIADEDIVFLRGLVAVDDLVDPFDPQGV